MFLHSFFSPPFCSLKLQIYAQTKDFMYILEFQQVADPRATITFLPLENTGKANTGRLTIS